jgi:glycopeptide antibiotics resistance protein
VEPRALPRGQLAGRGDTGGVEILGGWVRQYLPVAAVIAVPAVLLWVLLSVRRRARRAPLRSTIRESGADVLLAVSVLAILALTILPGGEASGPATGRSLVPFEDLLRSLGPGMPAYALDLAIGNLGANLLLFVPLGVALGLRFPGVARWRLLLACTGLSLLVEGVQLTWSIGRSADITDVLMNTIGGFVGLVVAQGSVRVVRGRRAATPRRAGPAPR